MHKLKHITHSLVCVRWNKCEKSLLGCGNFTASRLLFSMLEMVCIWCCSFIDRIHTLRKRTIFAGYCYCCCWNVVRIHIRACTAHTFIVLSFVRARAHFILLVFACAGNRNCGIGVCDLSVAVNTQIGFCILCAAEAQKLQAVDIQQWQRAYTNIIFSVILYCLYFCFEFRMVCEIFGSNTTYTKPIEWILAVCLKFLSHFWGATRAGKTIWVFSFHFFFSLCAFAV